MNLGFRVPPLRSTSDQIMAPVYCSVCLCLYTVYVVLTKQWRNVDANLDGDPFPNCNVAPPIGSILGILLRCLVGSEK